MPFDDRTPLTRVRVSPMPAASEAEAEAQCPWMISEIKEILKDFLLRLRYRAPNTAANQKLRAAVTAEIVSWNAGVTPKFVEGLTDTSCTIAESAYAHTSYDHQLTVALYTACLTYIDDLGGRNPDVLRQFGRRFLTQEALGDPALERVVVLLRDMHEYFPLLSAQSITISTLDFIVGSYVEVTGKDMAIAAGATRYPWYIRQKTGIGSAYALFGFVKDWRDPADHFHLQLIPEIEHYTNAINDILSFYKESLAGETDNFIHLRAVAEQKDPLITLREVVEETLDSVRKVEVLTAADPQLAYICRSYVMGYTEFHFRASQRYHLEDLGTGC